MLLALSTGQRLGIAGVAAVFVVFALASSFLFPRYRPDFPGRRGLRFFVVVSLALLVAMLTAMVLLAKEEEEEGHAAEPAETRTAEEPGQEPAAEPAGDAAAGREVFAQAGCGACHTLEDAGSSGAVGPNLDEAKPSAELVVERVTNGKGAMPSFRGQLSADQIGDVAAYVVEATGS